MIGFVAIAALMITFALAILLTPLLRIGKSSDDPADQARRRLQVLDAAFAAGVINEDEYGEKRAALGTQLLGEITGAAPVAPRARGPLVIALMITLLLPASAIVLYRTIGNPDAIDTARLTAAAAPVEHGPDMQAAISKLSEKLKQNPNDAEGWALLGRAYKSDERFSEAREALKRATELEPDNPDILLEYAEALALSSNDRRLTGEARALIERALTLDAESQRGLWLLGISDYQARNYDTAITSWTKLLKLLPKDTDVARSVSEQIAAARKLADGVASPVDAKINGDQEQNNPQPKNGKDPKISVHVIVDPALQDKITASDVLFVFAKAVNGPPMPLAIQRMEASKLPITITLDNSMGMLPNIKLSQFPQVILGARISKSGNAIAQSGDLQTQSAAIDVTTEKTVELSIDETVP